MQRICQRRQPHLVPKDTAWKGDLTIIKLRTSSSATLTWTGAGIFWRTPLSTWSLLSQVSCSHQKRQSLEHCPWASNQISQGVHSLQSRNLTRSRWSDFEELLTTESNHSFEKPSPPTTASHLLLAVVSSRIHSRDHLEAIASRNTMSLNSGIGKQQCSILQISKAESPDSTG